MLPNLGITPLPAKPPLPPPPLSPIDLRAYHRHRTVALPPIGFRPLNGSLSYATLRDISFGGISIARAGQLDLPIGTQVQLLIHLPGKQERISLSAKVRWCRYGGRNTYIGLGFDDPLQPTHPILVALLPEE
jgi:hypothetical protein